MKFTQQTRHILMTSLAGFALAACGNEPAEPEAATAAELETTEPEVVFEPSSHADGYTTVAKPGAPYRIAYRIIGTPIVGSPVTIALQVKSTLGPRPVTLSYRVPDADAMTLAESQPASVRMEAADNEAAMRQQVTVVPLREGRLYLNVSAAIETEQGTQSTVAAVPLQVGGGQREMLENGRLESDENGETVRVIESGSD